MLSPVPRAFAAWSSGFPVGSEPWTAARFGVYEDFSRRDSLLRACGSLVFGVVFVKGGR